MIIPSLLLTLLEVLCLKLLGYFLSPEFILYPYLFNNGMLPYLHILDQHPPFLFFGPLSIPAFISTNPNFLIAVWVVIIFFTNLLVLNFKNKEVFKTSFLLFSSWIIFSGRTLWTDTFLIFFTLLYLTLSSFLGGIFLAFIILLKPTYTVIALALFFYRYPKKIKIFFLGLILPLLITTYFLYHQHLFNQFYYYLFTFNKDFYLPLASKLPEPKEFFITSLYLLPFLPLLKPKQILLSIFFIIPAIPRFEISHLFPLSIIVIALLSHSKNKLLVFFVLLPFTISLVGQVRHRVGNFYYQPQTIQIAQKLNSFPDSPLLVIGASDLLYPLTNRLPPNLTYLPMLPWYLADKTSLMQLTANLITSPSTLVVIDRQASLSGVKIIDRLDILNKAVNLLYQPVATIGATTIYSRL